jgi:tripeptide aminopeptidase
MEADEARGEKPGGALELFLDLVRTDSPTFEEAGVASLCARELEEIGFSVRFDDSAAATGSDTGNLIAELVGDEAHTVVLCAHMDCVEPCRGVRPKLEDGFVSSQGDTVLGADDKAGIAAAITAARRVAAESGPMPTVRMLFTVQEEIGLRGAKALDPAASIGDLCLVLDAEGPVGTMISAAPTHYTFAATFMGRAAHAGVSPEDGVSAIVMATDAIGAMQLGRLDEDTTANIGTIEGGSATNVVPPVVTLTGECRSQVRSRVEGVKARMEDAMRHAAESHGGSVAIEWTLEYESYSLQPDEPVVVLISEACRDIGLEPRFKKTGGGSDANVFAARGVPTAALSCGMMSVHSREERMAVADLEALTDLVSAIIRRVARLG